MILLFLFKRQSITSTYLQNFKAKPEPSTFHFRTQVNILCVLYCNIQISYTLGLAQFSEYDSILKNLQKKLLYTMAWLCACDQFRLEMTYADLGQHNIHNPQIYIIITFKKNRYDHFFFPANLCLAQFFPKSTKL